MHTPGVSLWARPGRPRCPRTGTCTPKAGCPAGVQAAGAGAIRQRSRGDGNVGGTHSSLGGVRSGAQVLSSLTSPAGPVGCPVGGGRSRRRLCHTWRRCCSQPASGGHTVPSGWRERHRWREGAGLFLAPESWPGILTGDRDPRAAGAEGHSLLLCVAPGSGTGELAGSPVPSITGRGSHSRLTLTPSAGDRGGHQVSEACPRSPGWGLDPRVDQA